MHPPREMPKERTLQYKAKKKRRQTTSQLTDSARKNLFVALNEDIVVQLQGTTISQHTKRSTDKK